MSAQRLRAPIVLVHGLLGFDRIRVGPWELARYFPGIEEHLRAAGNRVLTPALSMTRGVADRAAQLRRSILAAFPHEPVHIIAHSMGGLDARHMISRLGMAGRVLTLTTVGTPHQGCSFADWSIRRVKWLAAPALRLLGVCDHAFHDLTVASCRRFNDVTPDAPGVRYFSIAGRCDPALVTPLYRLPQQVVSAIEGPNDGMVSLDSARFGESFEVWDADHMGLVNWPNRRARVPWGDRIAQYGRHLERLASLGF